MSGTISLRQVWKSFGSAQILRGLTVEVPLDGVTFIVGQSGSGKSVLCRLAVGLLRPERGSVWVLGEEASALPERKLQTLRARVPYLVQGPSLLDWLTVEENVQLGVPHDQTGNRTAKALARLNLTGVAQKLPSTLSPATRKRVAFARALALEPECLLIDEPTTGLDRATAKNVNAVMSQIKAEGQGAIVVSHDYESLRLLADRVLVVAHGQAAFLGTVSEFFNSSHPDVRVLTEAALKGAVHG